MPFDLPSDEELEAEAAIDAIAARERQGELDAELARKRARAVAGVWFSGDETVEVPCSECGDTVVILKCIQDRVDAWNKAEIEHGKSTEHLDASLFHKPQLIHKHEVAACEGACTLKRRQKIARQSAADAQLSALYLNALKEKQLSSEGATWLRRHGYNERVTEYYKAQNTTTK